MKKISIIGYVLIVFLAQACEYEKLDKPKTPHKAAQVNVIKSVYTKAATISLTSSDWKLADYMVVPLSNVAVHNIDASKGFLNGSGTFNGLNSFNNGDSVNLTIKSVYNDSNIYLLVEWKDASYNLSVKEWLWNGPRDPLKSDDSSGWTSQKNDDKLRLSFATSQQTGYTSDVWLWSASLSDPLGYAIDMGTLTSNNTVADDGTPMFVRNGTSNTDGPLYEYSGVSQLVTKSNGAKGSLDPNKYLYNKMPFTGNAAAGYAPFHNTCGECHGHEETAYAPPIEDLGMAAKSRKTIKAFILDPNQHQDGFSHVPADSVVLDNIFAWIRGQLGVAGYYLQNPSGSIADVLASSNITTGAYISVNKKGYKVLLSRKLVTGHADDIAFNTNSETEYNVSVSLSDNDSINFIGAVDQKLIFKKTWDEK